MLPHLVVASRHEASRLRISRNCRLGLVIGASRIGSPHVVHRLEIIRRDRFACLPQLLGAGIVVIPAGTIVSRLAVIVAVLIRVVVRAIRRAAVIPVLVPVVVRAIRRAAPAVVVVVIPGTTRFAALRTAILRVIVIIVPIAAAVAGIAVAIIVVIPVVPVIGVVHIFAVVDILRLAELPKQILY